MKRLLLVLLLSLSGYSITFTDIPDSSVFQFPHAGRSPGRFPVIAGAYTGSPTSISAGVLDFTADTFVKAHAIIDASPTGGTFSGTLTDIPLGGPYRLVVKSSVAGDTLRGSNKWGVGEVIGACGQSNITAREAGGTSNTIIGFSVKYVNDVPYKLNDSWQNVGIAGTLTSVIPACANTILSDINNAYPIAFCGYALGSTSMTYIAPDPLYWSYRNPADHDDPNTLYGHLLVQIQNQKPNTIIVYQGEQDQSALVTEANYTTACNLLFSNLADDLGYTPIICIVQIRERTGFTDLSTMTAIPLAQRKLANDSTILLAACTFDLGLYDDVHLDTAAKNKCGRRMGHTIARSFLGTISNGYRFSIDSAYVTVRGEIRILTNRIPGNTIIAGSISPNRFSYRNTLISRIGASSAFSVGDTAISLIVGDHFMTLPGTLEYDRYRITNIPATTDVIYDSDSLPLEPDR
jgi:hypothetical protein